MKMTIRRFEVERISVTSSKPFEVVVAALNAVGRLGFRPLFFEVTRLSARLLSRFRKFNQIPQGSSRGNGGSSDWQSRHSTSRRICLQLSAATAAHIEGQLP